MSDTSPPPNDETVATYDAYEQLDSSDTLDTDALVDDPLDTGYSPPERYRSPDRAQDTIEERIHAEIPDPASAYGAPDNESGLEVDRVGGNDPDAIDAEDDWLGDGEVGGLRSGRLVAPDAGVREDTEADLVGEDVGVDGGAASAEEAAVHIIEDEQPG